MQLPQDFEHLMRQQIGDVEYEALAKALDEEPITSIRLNTHKPCSTFSETDDSTCKPTCEQPSTVGGYTTPVPWCQDGFYLKERPQFTLDPLFHAGCYYVQEASSMFLSHLLHTYLPTLTDGGSPITALDLCAAPGGKSTLIQNALPEGSTLIANEPIRQRAQILRENIIKWGNPNAIVTSNYAPDFQPLGTVFDLIVCDAPCSGEGMFRKDPDSIKEWSLQNVETCWKRQREIVTDIWDTLRDGGLFIYSTCTYNHFEDEDNVQWIAEELGAEILPLCDNPSWGIQGGHFFPHHTRGEGFFVAVLRKQGGNNRRAIDQKKLHKHLHVLLEGVEHGTAVDKKGTIEPHHHEAMATSTDKGKYPSVELTLDEALDYLRCEALHLPSETPRGYIMVTYLGHPLGFCKNIGNRANNLYPKEWRIRKK